MAYCKARGWKEPVIYREKKSGADVARTVLGELMRDARRKKFDVVAVWKLDRLGRSLIHLMQVVNELSSLGIGVVDITQGIDTSTRSPAGNVILTVIGAMAQFERELISERTIAGVASARKRGSRMGRPGLDPAKTAEVVRLAGTVDRAKKPLTLKAIALRSGVSVGKVWKILNDKNRVHKRPPLKTTKSPEGASKAHKPTVL